MDPEEHLQLFGAKLNEFTIRPTHRPDSDWNPKPFVRTEKIASWMKEPAQGSKSSNLALLLESSAQGSSLEHADTGLWSPASLSVEHVINSCPLVFCILLELGYPDLLYHFLRRGVIDSLLPVELVRLKDLASKVLVSSKRSLLSSQSHAEHADTLARDFNKEQWKYCATKFEARGFFSNKKTLPFTDRALITSKGATAKVYEVFIPGDFLDKELKSASPTPISQSGRGSQSPEQVYRYALKVFKDGDKQRFDNEVEAYKALQNNPGMVKYLGDFTHEVDNSTTHNILLEYAEHDLAEYLVRSPPLLTDHIRRFWDNLLGVATSINGLHSFEVQTLATEGSTEVRGCHADIKPENILLVRGVFKLADPGFARFHKHQDDARRQDRLDDLGGTLTYSAPERYTRVRKHADYAKCDLWSYACVLSEAATWVVLGHSGIQQYDSHRRRASTQHGGHGHSDVGLSISGDCFHDGSKVLREVTEWHDFLRTIIRPTDTITAQVLDYIDKRLLIPDSERANAEDICRWWGVMSSRESQPAVKVPEKIQKTLDAATNDETEQLTTYFQSFTDVESRKAAKSTKSFFPIPNMKRLTRDDEQGSTMRQIDIDRSNTIVSPFAENPKTPPHHANDVVSHDTRHSLHHSRPSLSMQSPGLRSSPGSYSNYVEAHTVFDAYYADLGVKENLGYKVKSMFRQDRSMKKDERLASEIVNRDLMFLVDNGETMQMFWSEAVFVLERLVAKTWNIDPDGLELRFTSGPVVVKGKRKQKDQSSFRDAMSHRDAKPKKDSKTDMRSALSKILFEWLHELRKIRSGTDQPKPLTVVVLTDGKWLGMREDFGVDDMIVDFHNSMSRDFTPDRLVTIQFISFGDDSDAIYRLRRLDNNMGWKGVPDIIDTTPSTGDVYQMLLGSITDEQDQKNDELPVPREEAGTPAGLVPVSSPEEYPWDPESRQLNGAPVHHARMGTQH